MTDPAAARSQLDAIFNEGGAACESGVPRGANPYGTLNATEAVTWDRGWLGRHEAMLLDLKSKPAAARSRPAQLEEIQEDTNVSRVEPFRPCVASTGSTAEPPTGAVTAAERIQKFNERFPLSAQQAWTYDNPYTNDYALLRDLIAERAALAAARLALQQERDRWQEQACDDHNARLAAEADLSAAEAAGTLLRQELEILNRANNAAVYNQDKAREERDRAERRYEQLRQDLQALVEHWLRGPHGIHTVGACFACDVYRRCAADLADRLARLAPQLEKGDEKKEQG